MTKLWSISSLPIVNQIDSSNGGAHVLEFIDDELRLGWVVAAHTSKSYENGPSFVADHAYWYFDEDLTRYSSYTIEVTNTGSWPERWTMPTEADYEWVIDESTISWNYASVGVQSGFTYYEPDSAPLLKFLHVKWPTSSTAGAMHFWSSSANDVLGGSLGTTYDMDEITPQATDGYRAINVIPAQ